MQMLEWIRFILGTGLLLVGLGIFLLQVFGVFKFKYVLNRMHAAAMLLKENELSVGRIAQLLKYSSIYTFSRAFKSHFGVSPSQYIP